MTAAAGGSSTFALPGAAMYPTVPTYPSTFDFGQFSAFGGADNATVTFSASPEFASTSFSVKYDVGGTRPESDLSDKVVVTKTMKLKPATTRAATQAATRAGEPLPYEFVDNYTITVPAVADAPKRTYIDAWVYIHSFDGPGGTDSIRVRRYAGGDASKILYLASDGKLQGGGFGSGQPVSQVGAMLFKFGSVVGLNGENNTDTYDTGDIKFNPSEVVPTADWATAVPTYAPADWDAGIRNTSSPEYNTLENLKKGKGDPCMLIGYDVATIKGWDETAFNAAMAAAQYRLPTVYEDNAFVGGPAVPTWPATITYWKDWKIGDPQYRIASTNSAGGTYTYPNGATDPLKYNFWTVGTEGTGKLPVVAQGAVAAGAYAVPSLGYRDKSTGVVGGTNTYWLNWLSTVGSPTTGSSGHVREYTRNGYYESTNFAFSARCVAR